MTTDLHEGIWKLFQNSLPEKNKNPFKSGQTNVMSRAEFMKALINDSQQIHLHSRKQNDENPED